MRGVRECTESEKRPSVFFVVGCRLKRKNRNVICRGRVSEDKERKRKKTDTIRNGVFHIGQGDRRIGLESGDSSPGVLRGFFRIVAGNQPETIRLIFCQRFFEGRSSIRTHKWTQFSEGESSQGYSCDYTFFALRPH